MITKVLLTKLKDFFESEAMDPGYITAKYVYKDMGWAGGYRRYCRCDG